MKKIQLSVIIVNYNVAVEIEESIRSIYGNLSKIDLDIIVIDNNSPDRSIEKLANKFPDIRLLLYKENYGYSKANNIGVSLSKYETILILNPDTVLIEDFVTPIVTYIDNSERTGVCGPMLLYKDRNFQSSNGLKLGIVYETAEALMFINYYRKLIRWIQRNKYNSNTPFKVNWMSGACFIVKKDIFLSVGGFNTEYFMNYEDIDICKRISDAGYYNYYFPFLKCIHLDQTSQKRDYEKFTLSRYSSRLMYAKNNYNTVTRFIVRIIHVSGLILRLFTVGYFYEGREKVQRQSGYKKALKLYLGFN